MPVSSGTAYSVVASTMQNCSLVLGLSIPGHSLGLRVNGLCIDLKPMVSVLLSKHVLVLVWTNWPRSHTAYNA